ncbi:hypothetical protein PNEG_01071 [Pneumocystis murina B123]|uniref:G-patch domain-containing protein n=1 Tax=Pneumocystis murina (strain B123) TaxID=1069680 RepID=M7PAN8_PNEMU|nr:hypothetical protein PNEG_01071 [Pneumocystis murina B123]EMR10925.1 hypothetical protein PNEG_01071 [Pneumocystis murina B123]
MGLAEVRNKQKIGQDPRNMKWVKDINRFGFKHLLSYGWKPGLGLGKNYHGKTGNISSFIQKKQFILDSSFSPVGLNDLNEILGRLNNQNFHTESLDSYNKHVIFPKIHMNILGSSLSTRFVRGKPYKTEFTQYLKYKESYGISENMLRRFMN